MREFSLRSGSARVLVALAVLAAAAPAGAQQRLPPLSEPETQRAEKHLDAYAEALGEIYRLAEICGQPMTNYSRTAVLRAGDRFGPGGRVTALMWWDTGHDKDAATCDDAAKRRLAALKQKAQQDRTELDAASVQRNADGEAIIGETKPIP